MLCGFPGDWLSGRAPRSHRGGHWFDPSIAHTSSEPVSAQRRPALSVSYSSRAGPGAAVLQADLVGRVGRLGPGVAVCVGRGQLLDEPGPREVSGRQVLLGGADGLLVEVDVQVVDRERGV